LTATRERVLEALKQITDPVSGSDIVAAGVVRALNVEGTDVRFVLEIDPARAETYGPVRDAAEAAAKSAGASSVSAVLTGHSAKEPPSQAARAASANPPSRPISPARWPPRGAGWAFWMPMSTGRHSRG
jgi:ATP-binding protein involved in chromosome partitioning